MNTLKNILNQIWQSNLRWPVVIVILVAFLMGFFLGGGSPEKPSQLSDNTEIAGTSQPEVWTCSMHPQIRQPKPGQCPICGMDLIPVTTGMDEAEGPRQLQLSSNAIKLAEIETAPVERKYVAAEIRMVGKVEYDETRVSYISAWVAGRIDKLYVDFTGTTVREGDHLVYLYSPELISAQEELLQALKSYDDVSASGNPNIRQTARLTLEAVREKLRLLGLTEAQIKEIEKQRTVTDHLTIYSPISGVVIHRNAREGMYVNTGTPIYTIADLSNVWVKLDAYESDLQWIRYGQEVDFTTEAYPGKTFTGQIVFIDPVLDAQTRTVKVRVNVPNRNGLLKPEMFVRAVVRSKLSVAGRVMDPSLAGKWISPMHPEIVKNGPGKCDVCGMALVRAEELGYVPASAIQKEAPLVIPASAPLITGTRAVVYVADPNKEGVFEGKDIVLGPRAGDYYLVRGGLQVGERVVTHGNFKLDSDLQIKAKASMMNPDGGGAAPAHHHGEATEKSMEMSPSASDTSIEVPESFRAALSDLTANYFDIQQALSQDEADAAQKSAQDFQKKLSRIDMKQLSGQAHEAWMALLPKLQNSVGQLANVKDIKQARNAFEPLSGSMYALVKQFGTPGTQPVYRYFCPMAFDNKGAYWLQNKQGVENPYFGSAMFKCGEEVETLRKK